MIQDKYPVRHISIRVPWHDSKWVGTICNSPHLNGSCLCLPLIADKRNDELEKKYAGCLINDLDENKWPVCLKERATFMAPFDFIRTVSHPYQESSPKTHGHLSETPLRHPAYSAGAIPFNWMFKENLQSKADELGIDVSLDREPDLGFGSTWVQDGGNQKALLDSFIQHLHQDVSLCFFYAKEVPFVEDSRRVLIGVGRVKHTVPAIHYDVKEAGDLRPMAWECMVQHSIRPDFLDGFLLPYHEAIAYSEENPAFDPAEIVAFAPEDRHAEFSYASEHVSHDGALSALLACGASLNKAKEFLPGPWDKCLKWIHDRIGELWIMRGPCPGLGAALCAFGMKFGAFIAREIEAQLEENQDPWPIVEKIFTHPSSVLSAESAKTIPSELKETWQSLNDERKSLLRLVSRFELTADQAKQIYVQEIRQAQGLNCTDQNILENPYLLYEETRLTATPISIWTVDRGVFPDDIIRKSHPLPAPSTINSGTDKRRVRALTIHLLEKAAEDGHTLQARKDLVMRLRNLPIEPSCEVTGDIMVVAEKGFLESIVVTKMADDSVAYQLSRLNHFGLTIKNPVQRRVNGKRFEINQNWRALLDQHLGSNAHKDPIEREQEELARKEKAAALKELAESRFSVLIGPAGTGKTTLLSILCSQPQLADGGVLLLAPTGKARVRMEQGASLHKLNFKGYTIAQFLNGCGRYDGSTGRYRASSKAKVSVPKTVIIDESSMLTEEMLGALLDGMAGYHRLILIGDPRQLPPIGPGRPFVDIVRELAPANVHGIFPRVGKGYAELTIRRRQEGCDRADLQLAEWFGGEPIAPGEDEIFDHLAGTSESPFVRFVEWNTPEEFQNSFLKVFSEELKLSGPEDIKGFDHCCPTV